ncbi:hypothetical protein ACVIW2_004550 [Bradyrhizobium huanghuaihaiense]|jgi:hypothetical protein|nr:MULTISPECIES: hypothetical protein [Bradyrhizobium]MBP1096287.1 hypothetical protein [Bradyrhizobium japonicum]MCP1748197.1 hypothetical protein [Bradyrhizobium japonicum]MCP1759993.1 hypothetical protein [Bradyrhizobium japonicum]MCP1783626.1 hypothetical protein [Bradyrhizobium japonicum]MCP1791585.1 hypothetical protein [Bradyrhizobium japonicum]
MRAGAFVASEPYGMEVSTKAVGTPEEAITIWNGDRHKLTPT